MTAAQQAFPSQDVVIGYTISDPISTSDQVAIAVSSDGGNTWLVPVASFTAGSAVGTVAVTTTATAQSVTWHAGTDWPGNFTTQCRVRVVAWNNGMAFIPGGSYNRGNYVASGGVTGNNTIGSPGPDADITDAPVYAVNVNGFLMDTNLVSGLEWSQVYTFAQTNGYVLDNPGSYKLDNYPVQSINWYDAVKWCNARSQLEGLAPVYFTNTPFTLANLYTSGDFDTVFVKPGVNGYRLPTEAEWEKAARGGLTGHRFPWVGSPVDTISWANANYRSSFTFTIGQNLIAYDLNWCSGVLAVNNYFTGILFDSAFDPDADQSAPFGPPPTDADDYIGPNAPYTSPIGSLPANAYGLYDMAGNLNEWCFDCYGPYAANQTNPQGPAFTSGSSRVTRGGSWGGTADVLRCAHRGNAIPVTQNDSLGFRCVRGF